MTDTQLTAEGNGPLLDPDCRDGKHTSCVGDPCECWCHDEPPLGPNGDGT